MAAYHGSLVGLKKYINMHLHKIGSGIGEGLVGDAMARVGCG